MTLMGKSEAAALRQDDLPLTGEVTSHPPSLALADGTAVCSVLRDVKVVDGWRGDQDRGCNCDPVDVNVDANIASEGTRGVANIVIKEFHCPVYGRTFPPGDHKDEPDDFLALHVTACQKISDNLLGVEGGVRGEGL